MKKKLVVTIIFLAFLVVSVIGFFGIHTIGNITPKTEASLGMIGSIAYNTYACTTECKGAPLDLWETCYFWCIMDY